MATAAVPAAARAAKGAKAAAAGAATAAAPGGKPGKPQKGSWKQRSQGRPASKDAASKARTKRILSGSSGKYRRLLIGEFIVCVLLLGLSPLARDNVSPLRFMKRGSATCAFFIVLGLVSSFGPGSAKASAAFGGLATVALLVDQREAFGKLATVLNSSEGEDADAEQSGLGPDASTNDDAEVVAT